LYFLIKLNYWHFGIVARQNFYRTRLATLFDITWMTLGLILSAITLSHDSWFRTRNRPGPLFGLPITQYYTGVRISIFWL